MPLTNVTLPILTMAFHGFQSFDQSFHAKPATQIHEPRHWVLTLCYHGDSLLPVTHSIKFRLLFASFLFLLFQSFPHFKGRQVPVKVDINEILAMSNAITIVQGFISVIVFSIIHRCDEVYVFAERENIAGVCVYVQQYLSEHNRVSAVYLNDWWGGGILIHTPFCEDLTEVLGSAG